MDVFNCLCADFSLGKVGNGSLKWGSVVDRR